MVPEKVFAALLEHDDTVSMDTLRMLYRHARSVAEQGEGNIVDAGAHRSAFTIALALGVRDAGRGKVAYIADENSDNRFSPEDRSLYLKNIEQYGVASLVSRLSGDRENGGYPVDLLWMTGVDYSGVAGVIKSWASSISDRGLMIFGNHTGNSDVDAAIGDHLPFSRYRLVERLKSTSVFRKQQHRRKLYLCGGMQSSGSTLLSWCFLQRQDLDGVYDMDNAVIHQDFSRVCTDSVWAKMTIGAFRLTELVELYRAQGWDVYPLLVQRKLGDVISSLCKKDYGFDGATGDDPPLYMRMRRFLADLEQARIDGWPVLAYERLMTEPVAVLKSACSALNLPWDESMITWTKPESAIAYMSVGSPSLRETRAGSGNLLLAIERYRQRKPSSQEHNDSGDSVVTVLESPQAKDIGMGKGAGELLHPVAFTGTRRQRNEKELTELRQEVNQLRREVNQLRSVQQRISRHAVFGPLFRLWRRVINPAFPALDHHDTQ